jgi:putative integral membrane protein (TIGR02587 family)
MAQRSAQVTWADQLDDIERALAGGFLFGIPLIYTVEAWDVGARVAAGQLLAFFLAVLALNWVLTGVSGFKEETTFHSRLVDAIEAMAVGIVGATVVLFVIGRLDTDASLQVITGRILIQSIPFSLGVSLSNILFRPRDETRFGETQKAGQSVRQALLNDIGATVVGAAVVSYAIAPTDEIDILSMELSPVQLAGLVIFSLFASYMIVFQSEFLDSKGRRQQPGPFQRPVTETVLCYVVSLLVALALLFFFDQLSNSDSWHASLDQVLVLGLPATIGGAAGRLAS